MTDQERLVKLSPIRVILRLENNVIEGKTEESFSMGWSSSKALIFWSGEGHTGFGTIHMDGVKWALENFKNNKFVDFIIYPLAKDSPIEIDWKNWLSASGKYEKRNATFTVKPHSVWQLRALAAERELLDLKPMFRKIVKQRDEADDKLGKIADILNPGEEEDEQL